MNRLIDLLRRQPPTTHRHLMPMKNLADRPPLDTESDTQLVHRLSTLVSGDEFQDLVGAESACPAGFGPIGGWWGGCGGVGKLSAQGLQGFYLRFRVIVTSPKVHHMFDLAL
ncbi:hypothetical protein [Nocardia sp. NPDC050412]|uniref:hypothetical protein n=1 Tax=Nocardia sp. NPDC050412 TaxID=3364320 RepID=UPI00378B6D3F